MARKHNWYRLDNAARVFPALLTKRYTTFFRLSVTLKNPVRIAALNRALELTIKRFPYFQVVLKKGFFWDYLEGCDIVPQVQLETRYPNVEHLKKDDLLFRVFASGRRISCDFCHMITDGTGALEFLKSLCVCYFQLLDVEFKDLTDVITLDSEINEEVEAEDAYRTYYEPMLPVKEKREPAFQLPFHLIRLGEYIVTTGRLNSTDLKKEAKKLGISVTDYLVALFIYALQGVIRMAPDHLIKHYQKPIRIRVPVNLRSRFPSKTLRNFFLILEPELDPRLGDYSFEEIADRVHHQLRVDINKKYLSQHLARNVRGESHWLSRIIPRGPMNFILGTFVRVKGQKLNTSSLSNMGLVSMPPELEKRVKYFDFIPQVDENSKISVGVISSGKTVSISFGRLIDEPFVERLFFSFLAAKGINVRIETNRSENGVL